MYPFSFFCLVSLPERVFFFNYNKILTCIWYNMHKNLELSTLKSDGKLNRSHKVPKVSSLRIPKLYRLQVTTNIQLKNQVMPSTRASKSTTRSGLRRQPSPPVSTTSSARKRAISSVADNTLAKKTKVDDETAENETVRRKKNGKKDRWAILSFPFAHISFILPGKPHLRSLPRMQRQRLACPLTSKGIL